MEWGKIKANLITELNSPERNLVNPLIRTRALNSIEELLKQVIIANPQLLLKIEKKSLLEGMSKLKKLNAAEKSIVNHIYDGLVGKPIPRRKS